MTKGFEISANWLKVPEPGPLPAVDETYCRLLIGLNGVAVTKYRNEKGESGERIVGPAYFLAEWLATNWWSIFHEPEKSDGSTDRGDYPSRHWIGAARNGFALPDLWMIPAGDEIAVFANAVKLNSARLAFETEVDARMPLGDAKATAGRFVASVVDHLKSSALRDTELQESWRLVTSTGPDEQLFCELIGALGLSPYEEHEKIEAALDASMDELDPRMVRDLCEAATPETFVGLTGLVREAFAALRESPALDFTDLGERPQASTSVPWKWGKGAADNLRKKLGIRGSDPAGGDALLRIIGLDPNLASSIAQNDDEQIEGAVRRENSNVRMALVKKPNLTGRRFAATRAAFLGWGAGAQEARLMTGARTPEQQASRAFAAEILAPIDYIRNAAGRGPISRGRIKSIADDLSVDPRVVQHQAENHQMALAG